MNESDQLAVDISYQQPTKRCHQSRKTEDSRLEANQCKKAQEIHIQQPNGTKAAEV